MTSVPHHHKIKINTLGKKITDEYPEQETKVTVKKTIFIGWTYWPFKAFKKVWVLNFNTKTVVVFLYVNLSTGRRRVLINGTEITDVQQRHSTTWIFETIFPDEKYPDDTSRALHIRIEQFSRTATLAVRTAEQFVASGGDTSHYVTKRLEITAHQPAEEMDLDISLI